jgi:tetratricopeptide (TPR) repeat protein
MSTLKKLGEALPDFLMSDDARDLHRLVRASAQKIRRTDFIKKAYEAAIGKARLKGDDHTLLRVRRELATIYTENEEEDKAIKELEEVFQYEEYLGKQDWHSDEGVNELCELYFIAAYSRAEGSREYARNVAKLKRMENREHLVDVKALSPTRYHAGLFLGHLNLLQDKPDEARPYFKDRVALAINLLEDDDVSNDQQAWEILAYTLFHYGDDVNGQVALSILHVPRYDEVVIDAEVKDVKVPAPAEDRGVTVPLANGGELEAAEAGFKETEKTNEVTKGSPAPKDLDGGSLEVPETVKGTKIAEEDNQNHLPENETKEEKRLASTDDQTKLLKPTENPTEGQSKAPDTTVSEDLWADNQPYQIGMCDGPCLRDFDGTDKGVYYCTDCYDTQICVPCFELFKKSLWLYKKCDLSHRHVFVHGPARGLRVRKSGKEGEKEMVLVGGEVKERGVWLDEIRGIWGLLQVEEKKKEKETEGIKGA